MRLLSITLTNFRQFGGEQRFDFSSTPERPVSILFGANGAGKTTLLNAFSWGLYGTLSDDVEQKNRLVTDSVWHQLPIGEAARVAVEIDFDHAHQTFRVLREATLRKESDQQGPIAPQIHVWVTRPDGSSTTEDSPQEKIKSILPEDVARFFFFNGERIEKLVTKGAYAEVRNDIKVLLRMLQVERAIAHLPKAERRFSNGIKDGGGRASEIQGEIDDLQEQESQAIARLADLDEEAKAQSREKERVTDEIRRHQEVAPVQARRDEVKRALDNARQARDRAIAERAELVGQRGFLAFTASMSEQASVMAGSLYRKGELPAPLKREFVDKLLEDHVCICGTPLKEHTEQWSRVDDWRLRAGLQAVETAWQKLGGRIPDMNAARQSLGESLANLAGRVADANDQVAQYEAEESELDGQLKNSEYADVQALREKEIGLEFRLRKLDQDVGAGRKALEDIRAQIEKKASELSRAEVKDELALKARDRAELVHSVKKALDEILAIREKEMRERLDKELKAIFSGITHQNHTPDLNEDFELGLFKTEGGSRLPVPKSTGENQILSLSFVAAVSKLARQVTQERGSDDGADGSFPIVMDAAFGSLDQDYQEAVARALARMAPQLVVLVSKSQGLGKVVQELRPYVSHIGIIESHTTAPKAAEESIELDGTAYPYIRKDDTDHSELKEIM
jgi:DNA sulfur modification protein DndD